MFERSMETEALKQQADTPANPGRYSTPARHALTRKSQPGSEPLTSCIAKTVFPKPAGAVYSRDT